MNKVYPSAAKALEGIVHDGQLLAVGGFGLCGIPEALIAAPRFNLHRLTDGNGNCCLHGTTHFSGFHVVPQDTKFGQAPEA